MPKAFLVIFLPSSPSLFLILSWFLSEETEYEYSGSDEEDENRGDERESR